LIGQPLKPLGVFKVCIGIRDKPDEPVSIGIRQRVEAGEASKDRLSPQASIQRCQLKLKRYGNRLGSGSGTHRPATVCVLTVKEEIPRLKAERSADFLQRAAAEAVHQEAAFAFAHGQAGGLV